jgi:hypothetical protein
MWWEKAEDRKARERRNSERMKELLARLQERKEREAQARSWRGEVNRYTVDECS